MTSCLLGWFGGLGRVGLNCCKEVDLSLRLPSFIGQIASKQFDSKSTCIFVLPLVAYIAGVNNTVLPPLFFAVFSCSWTDISLLLLAASF